MDLHVYGSPGRPSNQQWLPVSQGVACSVREGGSRPWCVPADVSTVYIIAMHVCEACLVPARRRWLSL